MLYSVRQNLILYSTTFCTAQLSSTSLDGIESDDCIVMSNDKVEAVERALAVLNAFAADRPTMTLGELAAATGFYKSTILRLAASLERFGYLIREDNGVFRLGPTLWRLGSIYRAGFNLGGVIRPELHRLVEATGETASFYIRQSELRVCLFRHNSPHAARHHLDEGAELPLNAGASAHVLMAYTGGKGSKARAVQQRGYCISLGERDPQVAAVAVPVFDFAVQFRGALAVSGLIGRFREQERRAALAHLAASADRLRSTLPASD
jgi:DNA-binding IclR family transcriptional regulator